MTGSSNEYALALFALAKEAGCAQQMDEGLSLIADVFKSTPNLYEFLRAPGVPKEVRLKTVQDAFQDAVPEYALSFLLLLCRKDMIELLDSCVQDYRHLYSESISIAHAFITSAVELTQSEKEQMEQKLAKKTGKQIEAEYLIDPALLGGVIVRMDGYTMDGSLRHRLQTMKEVMNQ